MAFLVRLGYRRLVAGDPALMLRLAADDVHFRFPGHSSFAADLHGRDDLRRWVERFTSLRPRFDVRDVVVSGMPWRTRVAVRFEDAIGDHYRNEGVEMLLLRWGRIQEIQIFLDTERITEWEVEHPADAGARVGVTG